MCIFSFLLTVRAVTPDPQGHQTLTQVGGGEAPCGQSATAFHSPQPQPERTYLSESTCWPTGLVNTFSRKGVAFSGGEALGVYSLVWRSKSQAAGSRAKHPGLPNDTGLTAHAPEPVLAPVLHPVRVRTIQNKSIFFQLQKLERTCSVCHVTSHFTGEDSEVQSQILGRTHQAVRQL